MAICGNCKAETPRVRTIINKEGMRDECPKCSPGAFEVIKDPSTQKIWMHHEVAPNEYEKKYDLDGVIYQPKPEYTAELQQKVSKRPDEDIEAENKKRETGRRDPMTATELQYALGKAREVAAAIESAHAESLKQAEQAELDAWVQRAGNA